MTKFDLPNAFVFLARAAGIVAADWICDEGFKRGNGLSLSRARAVYVSVSAEALEAATELFEYASDLSEQAYRAWEMRR